MVAVLAGREHLLANVRPVFHPPIGPSLRAAISAAPAALGARTHTHAWPWRTTHSGHAGSISISILPLLSRATGYPQHASVSGTEPPNSSILLRTQLHW